ncbi:DUF4362 domain-containing protein [Bacillus niameyensis]|uniref:DUF4362 domain-containing protein n=1 Tax=Bacillus niameyensis TaxID=1522308 RepID=UPI0007803303|nr:DUF4362 domain-containing protein [Bacillus niameyensis]
MPMRKLIITGVFFLLALVLTACGQSANNGNSGERGSAGEQLKPSVKGVKDVDVVNTHGSIEGIENMEAYYEKVQNDDAAEIRIVHYTIEGDPIITDLAYKDGVVDIKYDTSKDKFGSGEIFTTRCARFVKEVNPANTSYIAVDCDNEPIGMDEVLTIHYNVALQDRFEFRLNYGKQLENEVASKPNMKNEEGETAASTGKIKLIENAVMKQEVYKKLVFANYLEEKSFTKSCGGEEAIQYDLLVYINGAEREFHWSACDDGKDAVKFNEIAEYIISEADKPPAENPETIVQGYVLEVKDDTLLIGEDMNRLDYVVMKDEIKKSGIGIFNMQFTLLEGVDSKSFAEGDKIKASLNEDKSGETPSKAKVKDIEKIESFQ